MGNLLRLLAVGDDSCCGMPENLDVFVDFENAQVKIARLHTEIHNNLKESKVEVSSHLMMF